ncbi:MAG TPA: DAK2 domain-containing protein, partial [Acidimicrobiales bacterium]
MPVGEARRILTADDVHAIVVTFRDLLRTHQESINRLNVYPVPDGDTGTNMALTMESVVAEVEALVSDTDEPDMAAVCRAIGHGALMGGRGNSGVILSQILRALSLGFADAYAVGPVAVAQSLESAATGAYEAVSRPVEGTILTVARDAAAAATRAVDDGAELVGVIEAARVAGGEALARTPEQLPVLAAAGVVDAGGAGLLLLLDAALHVVDGRDLPVPIGVPAQVGPERVFPAAAQSGDDLRFEVMYLLEADDAVIPAFRRTWEGLGDSIVVVGGDGLWNCHVHTDDVGAAVEAGIEAGRPRSIRVTDLRDEVEEERWVREAAGRLTADGPGADGAGAAGDRRASAGLDDGPAADGPIVCGVVAVAVGTGVERLLRSLGAQEIVSGGQSMNPSVAELIDAIGAV